MTAGEDLVRLYNVNEDPGETKDLCGQKPELVKKMKQAFAKWNDEMPEPRASVRKVETNFNGDPVEWHI